MTGKMKKILLLSLILTVGSLMISTASAATWNIDSNATNAQIQSVINSANDSDTLNFYTGANYNDISLNINKSLTLNGNDAIINSIDNTQPVLNVTANNVIISKFGINAGNAIVARNVEGLTIENNDINSVENNVSTAISFNNVSNSLIEGNEINGNGVGRDAIGLVNSNNITVNDNQLNAFTRNGISLAAGNMASGFGTWYITIEANTFNEIGEECIFFGGNVSHVDIINNNFYDFYGNGINLARSASNVSIKNNAFESFEPNSVAIRLEENNNFHASTPATTLTNVTIQQNSIYDANIGILLYNVNNVTYWQNYITANGNSIYATYPIVNQTGPQT